MYADLKKNFNFKNMPVNGEITPVNGVYNISYSFLDQVSVYQIDYLETGYSVENYYAVSENNLLPADIQSLASSITGGFSGLQRTLLEGALFSYAEIANINFTNDANGAIAFAPGRSMGVVDGVEYENFDDGSLAGSLSNIGSGQQATGRYGDIWFNLDNLYLTATVASFYSTALHELGHSLGLKEGSSVPSVNDPHLTVMSDQPFIGMPDGWVTSLQLYDIAAIQSIYGYNYTTRKENTVYGIGKGFGATAADAFVYSIWDGAGIDLIDASGYSLAARIALRHGHFSSIGVQSDGAAPMDDNVSVAYYAVIENAKGTDTANEIIGNAWNNIIYGAGGDDKIFGDSVTESSRFGAFFAQDPSSLYGVFK